MKEPNDCYLITWEQYQKIVDKISNQIKKNNLKFDIIVPIMRGGCPLVISLSHIFGVFHIYPIQYKYQYSSDSESSSYLPTKLLSTIDKIPTMGQPHNILVTEGNHCTDKQHNYA